MKYKVLFVDIFSVEMITIIDSKKSFLKFNLCGGDTIEFLNCCTSGNGNRSSSVTCKLLNLCGFKVDLKYIENNLNFKLEKKDDAHNINFHSPLMQFKDFFTKMKDETKKVVKYVDCGEEQEYFHRVHDYIVHYKPFGTLGTHFSFYSSFLAKLSDSYCFIVGSESAKDSIDSMYVLMDDNNPFDNTTIEFVLKVTKGSDEYKNLHMFLKDYKN